LSAFADDCSNELTLDTHYLVFKHQFLSIKIASKFCYEAKVSIIDFVKNLSSALSDFLKIFIAESNFRFSTLGGHLSSGPSGFIREPNLPDSEQQIHHFPDRSKAPGEACLIDRNFFKFRCTSFNRDGKADSLHRSEIRDVVPNEGDLRSA